MDSTPAAAASFPFDEISTLVRAILRRKSGMSLRDDDVRPDNVDALELVQDVIARLWERHSAFACEGGAWTDTAAFAATVAHNAWSDHLRQKYPRRASLRNRVRYFLGHQPRYAVWESPQGETLAGLRSWSLGGAPPVDAQRWQALREGRERLPRGSVPAGAFERYAAAEWDRLLGAVFGTVHAPVPLDALVAGVADWIGLREDRVDSLDTAGPDGEAQALHDADTPTPEAQAEVRGMLRQLWDAVRTLKPDYRCAYLLNLPGPGKTRGDIEVFVLHGVATPAGIEAALALSPAQLQLAADALAALQEAPALPPRPVFSDLWPHLPLADAVIGRMLGLQAQQVINRRMLALRELARLLAREPARAAAGAAPSPPASRRTAVPAM